MSPEQANGSSTDHRTDLFSLGSVLYFMATGHPPFRAEKAMGVLHRICRARQRPAWEVNADVPDDLADIIDRLLEKKPSRRFESAVELKESLTRQLATLQQWGIRRRGRASRYFRRHQAFVGGTIVALASAVIVMVMLTGRSSDSDTITPQGQPPADAAAPPDLAEVTSKVLAAETADYTTAAQEVAERLQRLEAMSDASSFARPAADEVRRQIESFDVRLDELQGESFSEGLIPANKGDR